MVVLDILKIFDEWFELVQVSKIETQPTNESIDVIMTFTDGNKEVKFLFPTSYDICIVETNNTKTAYRIINHDVAKSVLRYGHDRVTCWGAGPAIENVQVFNSHISIKETFTADDGISFEKEMSSRALLKKTFSGSSSFNRASSSF